MTVSLGRGSGEPKAAKSALMLPTTATPLRSSMSQFCAAARPIARGTGGFPTLAIVLTSAPGRIATVGEPMTPTDESAVAAQLQRPPRGAVGIAYRCPCGKPAVVVTSPRLPDGTPFPTMYYLTCPRAVSACSSLESQ